MASCRRERVPDQQYALYETGAYGARFDAVNCIFLRNGYHVRVCALTGDNLNPSSISGCAYKYWNTCFGPATTWHFYDADYRYGLFYGLANRFADPLLNADYTPKAGSPALKSGKNLAQHDYEPVLADVYGEAWDGAFDMGCFKSALSAPDATKYAQQFVSVAGSDENDGTSADQARATVQSAVDHVAAGGTVTVLAGAYPGYVMVTATNATIRGASRDQTVLYGTRAHAKSQMPVVEVLVPGVTIEGLTITNGLVGVWVHDYTRADNCVISNCVLRENSYGVNLYNEANGGDRQDHWTILSHCRIEGNTVNGVETPTCYHMDTCLVARNGGIGIKSYPANARRDSIAVNCTIADNRGAYGVAGAEKNWCAGQNFYDCIISGHKIGAYCNSGRLSGDLKLYDTVVCNTDNYSPAPSTAKVVVDAKTEAVDDVMLDTRPRRAYWPLAESPVLGRATSRNATLSVKVYADLNDLPLRLDRPFAAGCFQFKRSGLMLRVY